MLIWLQDPSLDPEIQRLFARSADLSRKSVHLLTDINAAYRYLRHLQEECQTYVENSAKRLKDIEENERATTAVLDMARKASR
jgi:hypothetical protein